MTTKEKVDPWRAITLEELATHNSVENKNAWIAINGYVYEVSSYAPKHPGGANKIEKYAGKDATETFNAVHPYVKANLVLSGCQVAVLKGPGCPKRGICAKLRDFFSRPKYKSPSTYFKQDSIIGTYVVEFSNNCLECEWSVGVIDKRFLHVYKCFGSTKAWLSVYELPEPLESDRIYVSFRRSYRQIDIALRKPLPTSVWERQTHGIKENGKIVEINEGYSKFDAYIIYKKTLTPNILMFGIQIASSARIGVPLGFHVELHHGDIKRQYTPVCFSLKDKNSGVLSTRAREQKQLEDVPITVLYFMIKIYPNGKFTSVLDQIEQDDGREIPTLKVSTPHGYFNKEFLHNFAMLLLISGGTGITPMTRILQYFWDLNEKLRGKRIALWHFVHKRHDLIWEKQFVELDDTTSWFHYFPVLTQPSELCNWEGATGRISAELMNSCLAKLNADKTDTMKACVCGPAGFNGTVVSSISDIVPMENIFVFQN